MTVERTAPELRCPDCGGFNVEIDDPKLGLHTCRDCGGWIGDDVPAGRCYVTREELGTGGVGRVEPFLVGSDGDSVAADWVAEQIESWALKGRHSRGKVFEAIRQHDQRFGLRGVPSEQPIERSEDRDDFRRYTFGRLIEVRVDVDAFVASAANVLSKLRQFVVHARALRTRSQS